MMVEARKICQIDSEINIKNAFVEEENTHISFFFGFPTPSLTRLSNGSTESHTIFNVIVQSKRK